MKKIFITTLVATTALLMVSAEEYGTREKRMPRPMQAKMMATTTTTGAPSRGAPKQEKQDRPEMPKMEIPKTGDATIDQQLADLFKEQETKIMAIRKEYEAKVKAIIGDKKIINRDTIMGAGTRPMMDDMHKKMEGGDDHMMATGTHPQMDGEKRDGDHMMNGSGTRPMPVRRGEGDKPKPVSLFEGFFKSFFGGNPKEAVAEEVGR